MIQLRKALHDPSIVKRHLKRPFYHVCDSLYYGAAFVASAIRHGGVRTVIVLPKSFDDIGYGYRYSLWRALRAAGVRYYHRMVPAADLAIAWHDDTLIDIPRDLIKRMQDAAPVRAVVNAECRDVRKSTVGRVHHEVFGYSLEVDPETCTSTFVRKSETNFRKDGVVVQGPVRREPGFVYQRLVDNEFDDRKTIEYRVPVIGGAIPYVVQYCRPLTQRFGIVGVANSSNIKLRPNAEEVFSAAEIAHIVEFTKRMGCDYGELDVVRSNSEGRIYVLDCNHTPGLIDSFITRYRCVHLMSKAFYRAYLQR